MMEEESHVVDNISDHKQICQVLFDEIDRIKDQSDVSGRTGRPISGLSQSNQWRLGKSEGESGTPLPATNSDRQSQKIGLGNMSLNSPNEIVGDIFMIFIVVQNVYQWMNLVFGQYLLILYTM